EACEATPRCARRRPSEPCRAAGAGALESGARPSGVAESGVGPPLLLVAEYVVGLLDLLELLLRGLVARVDVRVEFPCQSPVGLFDLRLGGALRDAQNLVVIPLFHAFPRL